MLFFEACTNDGDCKRPGAPRCNAKVCRGMFKSVAIMKQNNKRFLGMMIEFFNQTSKNFAGCKEDTDCIDGFACQEPGFCGKKTYSIKEHILFG